MNNKPLGREGFAVNYKADLMCESSCEMSVYFIWNILCMNFFPMMGIRLSKNVTLNYKEKKIFCKFLKNNKQTKQQRKNSS